MDQPPLYKYLDVSGAKLTLGNKTLKHSKPSDFNDTEDLTIGSIFKESVEEALETIANNFTDVILQHLHEQPTCSSPTREKIQLIQQVYRSNPRAADAVRSELPKRSKRGTEYYRELAKGQISTINDHMQCCRVLCVTTHKDSEYMWDKYAEGHKGIAFRLEPNVAKDSKFQLFRPVRYQSQRPPLYENSLEFIADSLFGDQHARIEEIIDRIIYAKTLDWKSEGEYRLVVPVVGNEEPWDILPYHADEITELYLGCEMEERNIKDITNKALNLNPNMSIFRARRDETGALFFETY